MCLKTRDIEEQRMDAEDMRQEMEKEPQNNEEDIEEVS